VRGGQPYPLSVSVTERVKSDLTVAMKAGEKARVGALRLVLSELQKAAKEGGADELAVLRREHKRRIEAAQVFRDAGRDELVAGEEAEAALIEGYLPAQMSDEQLGELIARVLAEAGPLALKDMGRVMKLAMAAVDGRADGKRVSALVKQRLDH